MAHHIEFGISNGVSNVWYVGHELRIRLSFDSQEDMNAMFVSLHNTIDFIQEMGKIDWEKDGVSETIVPPELSASP